MIKNRVFFLLVILTMVVQVLFMNDFDTLYSSFPFLDGVPITPSYSLETIFLLYWFLPIVAMSFYFSGSCSDNLKHYGKILITRNYSRSRWMLNQYFSVLIVLLTFCLIQFIIFSLLFINETTSLQPVAAIKLFIMYFFTLSTLFSFQLALELYLSPQLSQLIVNGYIVVSVLFTQQIYNSALKLMNYLLIPNYAMGFKTGLTPIPAFQTDLISFLFGLFILIILMACTVVLSVVRIRKMDIY
ncbi:DUF2705 family protein [Bacillus sp. NEB1478]|uniref:DUF2705 family protein n=1 Tax=Bacillus sp. NEB1478 TaxID=3073816 RepID=UPI00287378F4|nr:DUF2705 family protein [Bacillus sp. NEB1478]WNB92538.1 DUF2705 family protein [Bacillus sp. NEB1478]